jgi:hypothetical protein
MWLLNFEQTSSFRESVTVVTDLICGMFWITLCLVALVPTLALVFNYGNTCVSKIVLRSYVVTGGAFAVTILSAAFVATDFIASLEPPMLSLMTGYALLGLVVSEAAYIRGRHLVLDTYR